MAINKNFVVKNGFEVATNLILADASTKKVGIGSTNPRYSLDVRGGIGATDVIVSGVATISNELRVGTSGTIFTVIAGPTGFGQSVGVGTANPGFLLDVRSPVSTGQTALYVQGDVRITGDLNVGDDISFDELTARNINVTGISTLATLGVSGVTTTQHLQVTGVSTFVGFSTFNNSVDIRDGLRVGGITTTGRLNVGVGGTIITTTLAGLIGIGTTSPTSRLHVIGDALISGVTTSNAYLVGATQVISSARQLQNIASLDATTTATIESAIANAPNTFTDITVSGVSTFVGLATFNNGLRVVSGVTTLGVTTATNLTLQQLNVSGLSTFAGITTVTGATLFSRQLNVSGVTTLGTVQISSGIITATSGIVTYYGDGSYLTGNARNLTATIGIGTSGVAVGYGVSFLDLRGPGLSTVYYNNNVGIATIFFQGGGSGSASIGIGTTPGEAFVGVITAGNLWYNNTIGRLFIYYQDIDSAQWVDASPSNVGVITSLSNVSFAAGSASNPSMYFIGDPTTGFFSPGAGQFTVVSTGSSILNINSSGINVTGIVTSTRLSTGNVVSSGIVTAQDFDALSDIKYKENINTVNNALDKVDHLRGVRFDWKESGLPSYGVIAQELQEVLPELVHGNDPKTVNYNGIIGVLIEAIKELKAEVEELKNAK